MIGAAAISLTAGGADAQWSQRFKAAGPDEEVLAMTMHDDGTGEALYVGGAFGAVDGQPASKVARWRDGFWQALPGQIDGNVERLISHNGRLIAAGSFANIDAPFSRIAQWNGASWQLMGAGLNNRVSALAVYNGELIAGGELTMSGSDPISRIARWDGTSWQPLGPGLNGAVTAMLAHDGALIVSGSFTMAGTQTVGSIAQWDGSAWQAFGPSGSGASLLTLYSRDIVGWGGFTTTGGSAHVGAARWTGSGWEAIGPGWSPFTNVRAMVEHEGKLIVGGRFVDVLGSPAINLVQWDGQAWTQMAEVRGDIIGGQVNALLNATEPGGSPILYIGGWFNTVDDLCANHIAQYSEAGWQRVSNCEDCHAPSGLVRRIAVHDDGRGEALFVAGACGCGGAVRINGIGRWDGASWSKLGSGVPAQAFNSRGVYAIATFDDGSGAGPQLYLGGAFTSIDGVPVNRIARWDGSQWHPLGEGIGNGVVLAMTSFNDGTGNALYVGGTFTSAGGQTVSRLAKWDGQLWSDVGGGVTSSSSVPLVTSFTAWDGGLVVAGNFTTAGGVPVRHLALWRNGLWSSIGGGIGGNVVRHVATWPQSAGEALVVAGDFVVVGANNMPAEGLAKWNGTSWQSIPLDGAPLSSGWEGGLRILPHSIGGCSQLYAASLHGSSLANRWNGTTWLGLAGGLADVASIWGVSFGSPNLLVFYDFAMFQSGLYVAGDFTQAGGEPSVNLAVWDVGAAQSCPADGNDDGQVDVDDLIAVILQWGPCATCTADIAPCGGNGTVDVDDLIAVILGWGPCP